MCMDVCILHIFVLAWQSTPSQISLNRILRFIYLYLYHQIIELFTTLKSLLRVQLKLTDLLEFR